VTSIPVARLPAGVLPQLMAPLPLPVGRPLVGVTGYRLAAVAPAPAARHLVVARLQASAQLVLWALERAEAALPMAEALSVPAALEVLTRPAWWPV